MFFKAHGLGVSACKLSLVIYLSCDHVKGPFSGIFKGGKFVGWSITDTDGGRYSLDFVYA